MQLNFTVNNTVYEQEISPDAILADLLRTLGYLSVKQGCDTANCGLCTVWVDSRPVLSCSFLAARAQGCQITTIEGLEAEAKAFGRYVAAQGADQCGFCSPGLVMNVLAMERELNRPTSEEIKHYLAGNLCRCTGYEGQLRAIENYLNDRAGRPEGGLR